MGTHVQYGDCDSQYQFTGLYDAQDQLMGVVNAVNLLETFDQPPQLIETVPVGKLMGIVFNESR